MASYDISSLAGCTIDFPLEITPEEIVSLTAPINTLLKSSYLLGTSFEFEDTFQSLFDIAEEIAGIEACGLILGSESTPGDWELKVSRRIDRSPSPDRFADLTAPAQIVAHFRKCVSMDPQWGPWSGPICDAWSSRSLVVFPLRRGRDIIGAIVFGKRESHPFSNIQVKLLWALAMQGENHLHRSGSVKDLSYYSFIDPLTHLYNRSYFDQQLEKEILRSRRTGDAFSLLTLDLDGFKTYNDRFLQHAGDITLQEFASILQSCIREVDTVARIGGDEFSILLLEGDHVGAHSLGQRIIQRFHRHLLPGEGDARTERLSVSIGVASFPSDSFDHADLVKKANRGLQIAKNQGGRRVCSFHEGTTEPSSKSVPADLSIQKIFDAGRSVVDMDKFLEILLFTGMQGLSAERGSIIVKTPDGADFTLRATIGFSRQEENLVNSSSFHAGPITNWVVEHQLPLLVSKAEDSPISPPLKKNGYKTDSFLSIPLTHRGKTLGALHLTHKKDEKPFTHEDLKTFSPISSEIASILSQGISFRDNVRTFSLSILTSLTDALELRYPFLSGHSGRVRDLSMRMGERMGLQIDELLALEHAGILHDVGIVRIPGNILAKKRALDEREMEMVRKHPFLGAMMLEGVPGMENTRRAILEHHENFDGTGYPYGMRGADISLPARILSVAEYYDSLLSARPHRDGLSSNEVVSLIRNGASTLFDPEVASLFLDDISLHTIDRSSSDH